MRSLDISEAETKLASFCDEVAATGEAIQITRRGHPLAILEPVRARKEAMRSSIIENVERWWAEYSDCEEEFPDVWLERTPLIEVTDRAETGGGQ